MKKTAAILGLCMALIACNNSGPSGVENDGSEDTILLKDHDSNRLDPSTDTSKGEDRVDTWKRDSSR